MKQSITAVPGDVAAYASAVKGVGGATITFEEEAFDVGVRHSVIDHDLADADADGLLDFAEFSKLIRDREEGHHSEVSLKKRFAALDTDGSGKVDMSEYIAWALRDALIRSSQRVLDLFEEWDADGSGTITVAELYKAVRHMGFQATRAQVAALFREVDEAGDGDGRVDYRELNAMLRKGAGSQEERTAASGPQPFGGAAGAPKDRQGWAQNRRAPRRKNGQQQLGRGPQPLSGLAGPLTLGGDASDPLRSLREALALNSSRVIDLFRSWDTDANGEIDLPEFRQALYALGVDESMRDHVAALFRTFDRDGSGTIEYRELNRLLRKEAEIDEELKAGAVGEIALEAKNAVAARKVDVGAGRRRMGMESGLLSRVELADDGVEGQSAGAPPGGLADEGMQTLAVTALLRKELKKNWTRVREIFKSWDTNGDGLIQPFEFNAAMRSLGLRASDAALRQLFASFDRDGGGTLDYEEMNALLKPRKAAKTLLTPSKLQRTLIPGRKELVDEWMAAAAAEQVVPLPRRPTPTHAGVAAATQLPPITVRARGELVPGAATQSGPPTSRQKALRAPTVLVARRQHSSQPQHSSLPQLHAKKPSPPPPPPPPPSLFLRRADRIASEKQADLRWFQQLLRADDLDELPGGAAQPQRVVAPQRPVPGPQRSRLWTEGP